ncbi:MAG: FemAB family XrtA/PEP-CTERM system-associated protein [Bryobacteraceae bacterium]
MPLRIESLEPNGFAAWDAYVAKHPQGTPFHLTAWRKTIEEIFGYRAIYLKAVASDGSIVGVLPLFLVDGFMTGKVLISSPFAVYGGILADSAEARDAIGAELRKIAETESVQYVDLRNTDPAQCLGLTAVDRYVTFTLPVKPMTDEELMSVVSKKRRNMVRKALKSPYSTRSTRSIDHFYRLLSQNYRRLGTPVFPRRFFERMLANFGDVVDIREILVGDQVAVAALNFYWAGSMHTYYAASDPEFLSHAPNDYMYFDFLRWAGQNGFHTFDFGRSKKETGTFEFKRLWGATEVRELPYEVMLVRRKDPPNFSPKNPKFEMAIKVWQKLPLAVTNALGPRLIRMFP